MRRFGTISSPNFPSLLPSNVNCTWHLSGSNENDVIQLEINGFDINDTESDDCSSTYVEISNYGSPGFKFCNDKLPPIKLMSTTNQVDIALVTSAQNHSNSKGFTLDFNIIDKGNSSSTTISPTTVQPLPSK